MNIRSKRINEAIEKSGYSYPELSKITGISKSSLQRYATGETKKIPIDCIEKIAKATNTDSRYLMCWDGPIPNESEIALQENNNTFSAEEIQHVKKYRGLDIYGKKAVDMVLNIEFERCKGTSESVQSNAQPEQKQIKKTEGYNVSELAIARSSESNYKPAPTEEQYNSLVELTDDMLGE